MLVGDKVAMSNKKCDMHVHCRGRDPEIIYSTAKSRGMDYVTITDHDDISASIELNHRYPNDTFTGCEFTVFRDRVKLHILVYGINSQHFFKLNKLRKRFNDFSIYINENNIAAAPAHVFHSLNRSVGLYSEISKEIISDLKNYYTFFEIDNYKKRDKQDEKEMRSSFEGKSFIKGSDAHILRDIGKSFNDNEEIYSIINRNK